MHENNIRNFIFKANGFMINSDFLIISDFLTKSPLHLWYRVLLMYVKPVPALDGHASDQPGSRRE